jgi:endogenous inhibitor of DNA gyrase (YacG/DUF329 family)
MSCRICGKTIVVPAPADDVENAPLPPNFPFCSERCRMADLGRWFAEDYRVGRPERGSGDAGDVGDALDS